MTGIVLLSVLPSVLTFIVYFLSGNTEALEGFKIVSCAVGFSTSFIQKLLISSLVFFLLVFVFIQYMVLKKELRFDWNLILAYFTVLIYAGFFILQLNSINRELNSETQLLWESTSVPLFGNYHIFMTFLDSLQWIGIVLAAITFFVVLYKSIKSQKLIPVSLAGLIAMITYIFMILLL